MRTVLAGCLQAIEVIKVLLCPEIAVKITEHTAKRKEKNQVKRINVDFKILEEDQDCKKRKLTENENGNGNGNGKEDEDEDENEKTHESSSHEYLKKKNNFSPLISRQILFDATAGEFHNFNLPPLNPSCAVCGPQSTIFTMEDSGRDLESHMLRLAQVTIFSFIPVFISRFYYYLISLFCIYFHILIFSIICLNNTSQPRVFFANIIHLSVFIDSLY